MATPCERTDLDDDVYNEASAMARLKLEFPKHWMMLTNKNGDLVPRSLHKMCRQEGLLVVETDDVQNIGAFIALLQEQQQRKCHSSQKPVAEVAAVAKSELPNASALDLGTCFEKLQNEDGQMLFADWMAWDWLQERVGPPGTSALLTSAATKTIWKRIVTDSGADCDRSRATDQDDVPPSGAITDVDSFRRLVDAVELECQRATAIQAALRGRSARREAERVAEQFHAERVVGRSEGAAVLAPFNPTPPCAVVQALDALEVHAGDVFYDLGCGDGRLLIEAARRGARCVGVEYDIQLVNRARAAVVDFATSSADSSIASRIEVVHGDACACDLTPATKIFAYLVPSGLRQMEQALNAAIQREVPIVSYTFSIPGWTPVATLTAATRAPECKVRLYRGATSVEAAAQ